MTFTKYEVINLRKIGWDINKAYDFGSIRAARVFASIKTRNLKRDLLIISEWKLNKEQIKAIFEMNIYLNNLIEQENYFAEIML